MKPNIILFTDASVEKRSPKGSAGCGFIILDVTKGEFKLFSEQVLAHKDKITNNIFIELLAILYGIREIAKTVPKRSKILVVTDCKSIVDNFSHNMKRKWNLERNYSWIDKSGEYITGQKQIREIIDICYRNHYKLKVIHIHSHTSHNITIPRKATIQIQKDLNRYKVKGDSDIAGLFIQFNRLVDLCAKAATKKYKNQYKENQRLR